MTLSTVSFYFTEAIWYTIVIRILVTAYVPDVCVLPAVFWLLIIIMLLSSLTTYMYQRSIAALIPCAIISSPYVNHDN